MKIGIRSSSLKLSTLEAVRVAAGLGYDGVEAVVADPQEIAGWLRDGAALIAASQESGCAVSSISLPAFRKVSFHLPDATQRAQGAALVRDTLRACRRLGCEALLLPFTIRETLAASPEQEAWIVEGLEACAPTAEGEGVPIALESSFPVEQLQRIMAAVGSERVGVYQDVANALRFGGGLQGPADMLRRLAPWIVMVHVKDQDRQGTNFPLGQGEVDWPGCREALREMGYDGWYVLETPPGDDPTSSAREYLDFTRQWVQSAPAAHPGR